MPTPIRADLIMAGIFRMTVPNSGQDTLQFFGLGHLGFAAQHLDNLRDTKGADQHRNHLDTTVEFRKAEGEARKELQLIAADAGEKKAKKPGNPALDNQIGAGEGAADQNAEEGQQKELEGGELQGKGGNHW